MTGPRQSQLDLRSGEGFNGDRLRFAREFRAVSKVDLGRSAKVTGRVIGYYEGGVNTPSDQVLNDFGTFLDFPRAFFFDWTPLVESTDLVLLRADRKRHIDVVRMLSAEAKLLRFIAEHIARFDEFFPFVDLPEFPRSQAGASNPVTAATAVRERWGVPPGPLYALTPLLETKGVVVVRADLQQTTDGLSVWGAKGPVIALGTSRALFGRLRFTLAHELGHLVMHRGEAPRTNDNLEVEANTFAASLLMPEEQFVGALPKRKPFYLSDYEVVAREWRVPVEVVLRRAQELGRLGEQTWKPHRNDANALDGRYERTRSSLRGEMRIVRLWREAQDEGQTLDDLAARTSMHIDHVRRYLDASFR